MVDHILYKFQNFLAMNTVNCTLKYGKSMFATIPSTYNKQFFIILKMYNFGINTFDTVVCYQNIVNFYRYDANFKTLWLYKHSKIIL